MVRDATQIGPESDESRDQEYAPAIPGDWTGTPPKSVGAALDALAAAGGGGGGGAPTSAQYVTLALDATLSQERTLTQGAGVKIADSGANAPVTVSQTSTVFIVDATGAGTISDKLFDDNLNTDPNSKVLKSFNSDNDSVTIHVEVDAGPGSAVSGWQPTVTIRIDGVAAAVVANLTQIVAGIRRFSGSATITASSTGTLTATTADGATSNDIDYTRALDPPVVNTAVFGTGSGPIYPGSQTQYKSGDSVQITGTMESHATRITVKDAGIKSGSQVFDGQSGGTFDVTFIAGSRSSATQTFTVFADTGASTAAGPDKVSTNTADQDQTSPAFSSASFTYPASQAAIKNVETVDVDITHTNAAGGDTYVYDDNSTGELTIPSTTTYSVTKTVTRLSGNYRDSGTNYRVTATRTTLNGKSATASATVKIAHVNPTIDITSNGEGSPKVFRSKTGTAKTYTITITSDQELEVAPTLAVDAADDVATLGTFSGGSKVWTATLTIAETGTKNVAGATHDFTSLVARNNADKTQNTINSGSAYANAGFESRDIAIAKFDQFDPIPTMVSNRDNSNKLTVEYVGLGAGVYVANTTDDPGSKKFTVVNSGGTFDAAGDYIKCNDSNIYDAVAYTMRTEESA